MQGGEIINALFIIFMHIHVYMFLCCIEVFSRFWLIWIFMNFKVPQKLDQSPQILSKIALREFFIFLIFFV